MELDEDDEPEPSSDGGGDYRGPNGGNGRPLPTADRVWRHPAEVAAEELAERRAHRRRTRRERATVAAAAGLTGAGLVLLVLAAIGEFADGEMSFGSVATTLPAAAAQEVAPFPPIAFEDTRAADQTMSAIAHIHLASGGSEWGATGLFVSEDGMLLTTASALEGATQLGVVLDNGIEIPATIVGTDESADIAVLKVAGRNLPVAVLGSASSLEPGDVTLVLEVWPDNKDGLRAVPSSIVSTRRHLDSERGLFPGMLQIERVEGIGSPAILITTDGRVVGLTTDLIDTPGYATTIDWAMRIAEDLDEHGRVRHAWMGLQGADVHADDADLYGSTFGVRIVAVSLGSPADVAGLVPDDVIVEADGMSVRSMADLTLAVRSHRPGESIKVVFRRDGAEEGCTLELVELPGEVPRG